MAGGNRSYWRKKGPAGDINTASYTTETAIGPDGKLTTYKVYELYQYNPGESQPVLDSTTGRCISRPGSDPEYYEQGPDGDRNRTSVVKTQPGLDGKPENYLEYTGSAGFQINHPNSGVSDKF